MSFLNLISEESGESLHNAVRRPALNNLPDLVGQANGNELLQGGHAAQDHVGNQPFYVVVKPWWLPLATDPIVAESSPPGTIILVSDPPGIQRQTTVHFDRQDHGTHASISVWQQGFMQWTLPFYSPSWAFRQAKVSVNNFRVICTCLFYMRIGKIIKMFNYFPIS